MAFAPGSLDPSQFSCSLCLELLKDPVTVPCGHSYCQLCLTQLWDREQSCRCPLCRATFSPRPSLGRNTLLQEMIRSLSLSPVPSAPPLTSFEHATFDISAVKPERNDGERLLGETRRILAQQIDKKESERQQLQNGVKAFSRLVKTAVKDSSKIFSELLDFVERRRVAMKELIRAQEKAETTRAENQLQRLEREIRELRAKEAQLETLSHSQDQTLITQMCVSLGPVPDSSLVVTQHVSFGSVRKAILDLKQNIETVYQQELPTVTAAVKSVSILQLETESKGACESAQIPVLDNRDNLLQYLCPLSVDPFTVHRELTLSEGNRVISRKGELHSYPDHSERFDCWAQALCHEALTGRRYWEVEWDGTQVALGVTYDSIGRKGSSNDCRLGHNPHSWSFKCSASSLCFCHGNEEQAVVMPDSAASRRIGLFLDHEAGLLCFFTVTSGGLHQMHRLEKRFSRPLFAAVWLGNNSSVSFCSKN